VSELNREAVLREVNVDAASVNDDVLDALLAGGILADKEIDEIANMFLDATDDPDGVDAFSSNWSLESDNANRERSNKSSEMAVMIADLDRIQKELDTLRSQYEFECEYVEQLEKEIISVTSDRDRQVTEFTTQIAQLQCQNTTLDISRQDLITKLEANQSLLEKSKEVIEVTQAKLSEVTTQRDRFEEELIKHLSNQAHLHQSLRGLENEYVSDLTRVQELEQQVEELQNHVLQQASRATEYEAAVQHWKEQSVRHQHHALQLSGALERLLDEKPVRHLTELPTHQFSDEQSNHVDYPSQKSVTESLGRPSFGSKVDLPFFLVRHR